MGRIFRTRMVLFIILGLSFTFPVHTAEAKVNVLNNGGFEQGTYEIFGPEVYGWQQDGQTLSRSIFDWDSTQKHSGSKSVMVSNETTNDARWVQNIMVQTNAVYRLSGWIKTKNVAEGGNQGASLAFIGTNYSSPKITGTTDWTYVYVDIVTRGNTFVQVAARLVGENGGSGGTAWFDDLKFELLSKQTCFSLTTNVFPLNTAEITIDTPPNCNQGSQYAYGTVLTLTANPNWDTGYLLKSWIGDEVGFTNPITVTMTANKKVTANMSRSINKNPPWKILVLVYTETDFTYSDNIGDHHFKASMSSSEIDRTVKVTRQFVESDIPALTSGLMKPILTIRFPDHPLTSFKNYCGHNPDMTSTAADLDPAFDSVIVIWDDTGIDENIGLEVDVGDCGGLSYPNGIGQTFSVIPVDSISVNQHNVLIHEWGHSILEYYGATGVISMPNVDIHINSTTNQYVNCLTGHAYVLKNETVSNTIPNSIYNVNSGFSHDYYSGHTASIDAPDRCLGVNLRAWSYGGPVTKP